MDLSNIKIPYYIYPAIDFQTLPMNRAAEVAINKMCNYYSVERKDVLGRSRKKEVVAARMVVAKYLWEEYKEEITLDQIAKKLGKVMKNGRGDHATAIHYIKTFDNVSYIPFYGSAYDYLQGRVGNVKPMKQVFCESLCTKQARYKNIHIGGIYTVFEENEERYLVRDNTGHFTWYKKAIFREI